MEENGFLERKDKTRVAKSVGILSEFKETQETIKNKIITLNLPDDLRLKISEVAGKRGITVNALLLDLIKNNLK